MTTEKMFEIATRRKLRFQFKGNLTVEELWDLRPEALDAIFKSLNSEIKVTEEESLLSTPKVNKDTEDLTIKIEIVKHIFAVKQEEENTRLHEKEKYERNQKILEIIASKQDQALGEKSVEELKALLEE